LLHPFSALSKKVLDGKPGVWFTLFTGQSEGLAENHRKGYPMSDTEVKERSDRPDYGIELVDELPPKPKRKGGGGGRSSVYDALLPQVAAHGDELDEDGNGGGRWVRIGTFHTRYGAQTAANSLNKQERQVKYPGEVEAWEFTGIRAQDDENGVEVDESYLFARYNAEAIEYVPPAETSEEDADETVDEADPEVDADEDEDGEDIFEVDE